MHQKPEVLNARNILSNEIYKVLRHGGYVTSGDAIDITDEIMKVLSKPENISLFQAADMPSYAEDIKHER